MNAVQQLTRELNELEALRLERDRLRAEVKELRKQSDRDHALMMAGEAVRACYVQAVAVHGSRELFVYLAGLCERLPEPKS